jgi:hypothetical protein
MKRRKPPAVCPVCSEDVPPNAQACPDCGACYESGWRLADNDAVYDGLDLPDWAYEDEDEKIVRPNMSRHSAANGISLFWRITAILLLLALFWGFWEWLFSSAPKL